MRVAHFAGVHGARVVHFVGVRGALVREWCMQEFKGVEVSCSPDCVGSEGVDLACNEDRQLWLCGQRRLQCQ